MRLNIDPRMSTTALEQMPEYWSLSVKQRLFVQTLVQSALDGKPDAVLATAVAYSTPNARTMSYHVLESPKIRAVLRVIRSFGKQSRNKKGR